MMEIEITGDLAFSVSAQATSVLQVLGLEITKRH